MQIRQVPGRRRRRMSMGDLRGRLNGWLAARMHAPAWQREVQTPPLVNYKQCFEIIHKSKRRSNDQATKAGGPTGGRQRGSIQLNWRQ